MNPPITRSDFLKGMVEAGLTYDTAIRAYNSVMSTIADGVVNGRRVYLGQVGVMNPTVLPPRQIKMGFARQANGQIIKRQREFYLDSRLKYGFKLFKKFAETHELKWSG